MKNKKKGFTLIEIIVALSIVVMISAIVIASTSSVKKANIKQFANTFINEIEATRAIARTHGGDAKVVLTQGDKYFSITRSSVSSLNNTEEFKDSDFVLIYKRTGVSDEKELASGETLTFSFAQTEGSIIGPDYIDYFILTNGSKDYKIILKHSTGELFYDYEIDNASLETNANAGVATTSVVKPSFVVNGIFVSTFPDITYTGKAEQPEFSYNATYVRISGVYRAIEKGTYTIVFSLKDPYTTEWEDGTTDNVTLTWTIK